MASPTTGRSPSHDPPALSLAGLSRALDRHRWARLCAFALLLVSASAFQGRRPLYDPDEGRYVATALEGLECDEWLIPHLHHEQPHVTKPPLTTWLLAGAIGLLGRTEAAVRTPAAVAFVLTVLATLGIARRFAPERAWLAAAIQATMLLPVAAANVVTPDPLLAGGVALALHGFAMAWHAGSARARHVALTVAWASLGVAFLAKGPPALLPALGFAAFAGLRRGRRGVLALAWPPALLGFAVLGLGWYVAACLRLPGLFSYFVGEEVVGRVATPLHGRNSAWWGSFAVYVPTLLLGTLPWTGTLLAPLAAPRRAWTALRRRWRDDEGAVLIACCVALPLLVFFVARSRLPLYLLPLFPTLALLAGRLASERLWRARWAGPALAAWVVVAMTPRWAPGVVPRHQDARELARAVETVAGGPLDEIAFVDMTPRYGLAFYVDVEVERVELGPEPERLWDGRPVEALAAELEVPEGRRLFAARTRRIHRVDAALAGTRFFRRHAAAVQDLTLFWLEPADPRGRPAAGALRSVERR